MNPTHSQNAILHGRPFRDLALGLQKALWVPRTRGWAFIFLIYATTGHLYGCIWEGESGLDPDFFEFFKTDAGSEPDASSDNDGGEPDDVEVVLDACQNGTDRATFDATDVDAEVESCVSSCAFDTDIGSCTAACVETATGLSSTCASCYGKAAACALDNCLNDCMNPDSTACASCRDSYCTKAFDACTGFDE